MPEQDETQRGILSFGPGWMPCGRRCFCCALVGVLLSIVCSVMAFCGQVAPFVDITSTLIDNDIITLPHLIGPEPRSDGGGGSNTLLLAACGGALVIIAGVAALIAWRNLPARVTTSDDDPYSVVSTRTSRRDENPFAR